MRQSLPHNQSSKQFSKGNNPTPATVTLIQNCVVHYQVLWTTRWCLFKEFRNWALGEMIVEPIPSMAPFCEYLWIIVILIIVKTLLETAEHRL